MYSNLELIRRYAVFYARASNGSGHGMHSPFVYDFIRNVLRNKGGYHPDVRIEQLRRAFKKDNQVLQITDLGAGSRKRGSKEKSVARLARTAVKPKGLAHVLYRLTKHYDCRNIIELGTSLGITTAYLASASPAGEVVTIEGDPEISAKAAEGFSALGLTNIKRLTGNFDDVLPKLLRSPQTIDLAYIDGNHRKQPTLAYFHQFLDHIGEHSVMVFDDIHWSAEMEAAWEEIKAHDAVRYSIDIFHLGFIFFRKDFKVKQHFCIRF